MTDEPTSLRPRRRNTKERIIDEAEALAAVHGIEHLKLQDVADRIGIKLPSVYAHFSGREDILAAMGSRINQTFAKFYVTRNEESAIETLVRSSRELASFLVTHPAYFRLILRDLSVPLGYDAIHRRYSLHVGGHLPSEMAQLLHRVQALLDRAVDEDQARPLKAVEYIAAVHGAALLKLSMETTMSHENLAPVLPSAESLAASLQGIVLGLLGKKRF